MIIERLKTLTEKLKGDQAKMDKILDQAGENLDFSKVTEVSGTDVEKCASFRTINDECTKTMKEIEELRASLEAKKEAERRREIVSKMKHPEPEGKKGGKKGEDKDGEEDDEPKAMKFGTAVIKAGLHLPENYNKELELDHGVNLKTLMSTSAGFAPETTRTGRVVPYALRPFQVIEFVPQGSITQTAEVYMEETTNNDAATETDEAGEYPEAQLVFTERSNSVRKVAVYLPITDEQLEDEAQVRGIVNDRLPAMVLRRLSSQVINGSGAGTPTQLKGIRNTSGIQSYDKVAGDEKVDALRRAMTLVWTNAFSIANGIVLNPLDWEEIRLMKTNDGVYVWGHPAEVGVDRVWGLPVALETALTQGLAIVGDFTQMRLSEKRGIMVKVSDSHSDFFIKGKQAIRADGRWVNTLYRPAAFVEVDLEP